MLLDREREQRMLEAALDHARAGETAMLALVGEPGIGKTALLDHAVERADGMRLLRARPIESEAQIPFASLLELLRPALGGLEQIPEPQALALAGALALRPAEPQERFAVGAATLSLLAAHAERDPLLVLIDDAQWLDGSSAQALLFAVRRLVADPIAVLIAVREGEPSLLDGAGLPTLHLGGLGRQAVSGLVEGLAPEAAQRLHEATGGNPLAMLELADEAGELAHAPQGAPVLVSTRISRAFLRRAGTLGAGQRGALLLAAASDSGDLSLLERAASAFGTDLSSLAAAERAGVVSLRPGWVEFRHPLARSAIYADAPVQVRRQAHRALAGALPDRDVDRRAWHLATAAAGIDDSASAALEQAGARARERSAYASAAPAFERAARLASERERRARLLNAAAESSWHGGLADRAVALAGEARAEAEDPVTLLDVDELAGRIATRRGPVMRGPEILTAVAGRADPERAVALLAEAVSACFYAGDPAQMLVLAERTWSTLPVGASVRARFLAGIAIGMARVVGGDAAAGAQAIAGATGLAEEHAELLEDIELLPWLAVAPIFLRETTTGRELLGRALRIARARSAVGALPLVLNLIAIDYATTDRWAVAEALYREAIELARESDQRTDLVFGLSGFARLQARRGEERGCRACCGEALALCERLGTRLHEVWVLEARGMLELGIGATARAVAQFERQQRVLAEIGLTDPDLSPAPELVDAHVRLGELDEAARLAAEFDAAARAKGQPWSRARALRCGGLLADEASFASRFEEALAAHARTPDAFEAARTRLAYGQRLRRAGNRVLAREQLREAADVFERLGARPWAEHARTELRATGETLRRGDPTTRDELTPQELQIALLLAGGRTTRETAAALFLSPKTIEYHLRHVYLKLDVHSRDELRRALGERTPGAGSPVPAR